MRKAGFWCVMMTAAAGLAGCAGPSALEQSFGESVREMQLSQRYVPAELRHRPLGHAPLDSFKAGEILEAYRHDVGKPQEVADEIEIRMRAY